MTQKELKIQELLSRGYIYDKENDRMLKPTITVTGIVTDFDGKTIYDGDFNHQSIDLSISMQQKYIKCHDRTIEKKALREKCKECRRCHIGLAGLCCDRIRAMVSTDSEEADPEPDLELEDPEPEK